MGELKNSKSLQDKSHTNLSLMPYPNTVDSPIEGTDSVFFLHIRKWIRDNAVSNVYVFSVGNVFADNKFKNVMMGFEKEKDLEDFESWVTNFQNEMENWEEWRLERLWPDKDDFDGMLEEKQPVSIQAWVEYDLCHFDTDGEVDDSVFELWSWMQDNCRDKVFRWDDNFVFSNSKDATLFKLRWLGEQEDEIP